MKKRMYLFCLFVGLSAVAIAAGANDFSGSWTLDREFGNAYGNLLPEQAPASEYGIYVTLVGDKLLVQSQCAKCGKLVREYTIDGAARDMRNEKGAKIRYTATWDGNSILIEEGFGGPTPFGPATIGMRQVWSLSADRKILTISSSSRDPKGDVTMSQIYRRVQ